MADKLALSTLSIHGDEEYDIFQDAAPPLRMATSFKYQNDPGLLVPIPDRVQESTDIHHYYYSRIKAPTTVRFEGALSSILHGHALVYPSGLSALHAALILLNPKRVSLRSDFYFGCQAVLDIFSRLTGLQKISLDREIDQLQAGDLIMLETPLSPSGEVFNIQEFAAKAHSRGAHLLVSSTLAPPGLQDPLSLGADLTMHSGSKYLGGHSDMLFGVLATNNVKWFEELQIDRSVLGNVVSNFDSWLGLRSLRTLDVRLQRQGENAQKLVNWLSQCLQHQNQDSALIRFAINKIGHTSLRAQELPWLRHQMPNGFGSVFSLTMNSELFARTLPSRLQLFKHCTSFGGVESTVEWRRMSDSSADHRLLRVSVGLENWEDLQSDMRAAFRTLND